VPAIAEAYVEEINQLVAELSTSRRIASAFFWKSAAQREARSGRRFAENSAIRKHQQNDRHQGTSGAMVQGAAAIEEGELVPRIGLKGLEEIYTQTTCEFVSLQARIGELRRHSTN